MSSLKVKSSVLLAAVVVVVLGFGLADKFYASDGRQRAAPTQPVADRAPTTKEVSIWDWRDVSRVSGAAVDSSLTAVRAAGIGAVYLSINYYVDLAQLPPGSVKDQKLKAFRDSLARYVDLATQRGIRVYAAAGDKNWSEPDNAYLARYAVKFVAEFNASSTERFAGLVFDVEAYNLDGFSSHKASVLVTYLQFVQEISAYLKAQPGASGLKVGFTVPFWLDGDNGYVGKISYRDTIKMPVYHLIDVLDQYRGSFLVVMDYRSEPGGVDGSIFHATGEVQYSSSTGGRVGIVIGQEVSDVKPRKITFWALGRERLWQAMKELDDHFAAQSPFVGFAIHDMDGFQRLRP